VMTVGIDYLSIGGYNRDGVETHQIMLGAGLWVIEGLDLSKVKPGRYELACLPLKIVGADGAPCRAVLRTLSGGSGGKGRRAAGPSVSRRNAPRLKKGG